MDYATITAADKLLLARDRLRGLESDHYRISIASEPNQEQRLADLEAQIEEVKAEVAAVEAEVGDDPTPEA
jgi:cell division protein FtsB